jgi:membrane protein DedA with SNARE-associated domain
MVRVAVVAAALPGVPSPLVFALAGWTRMRLVTFLALDAAGALVMTGLIAALGYGLGQRAVDVVVMIEKYAGWVSLAIIASAVLVPLVKKAIRKLRKPEKEVGRPSTEPAGTRESRPR